MVYTYIGIYYETPSGVFEEHCTILQASPHPDVKLFNYDEEFFFLHNLLNTIEEFCSLFLKNNISREYAFQFLQEIFEEYCRFDLLLETIDAILLNQKSYSHSLHHLANMKISLIDLKEEFETFFLHLIQILNIETPYFN